MVMRTVMVFSIEAHDVRKTHILLTTAWHTEHEQQGLIKSLTVVWLHNQGSVGGSRKVLRKLRWWLWPLLADHSPAFLPWTGVSGKTPSQLHSGPSADCLYSDGSASLPTCSADTCQPPLLHAFPKCLSCTQINSRAWSPTFKKWLFLGFHCETFMHIGVTLPIFMSWSGQASSQSRVEVGCRKWKEMISFLWLF